MLKSLRNKTLMKVIMWLLVVVFVAWGAGSAATSRKNHAGVIFGRKVSIPEYNRSYAAVLNRAKMAYGDNLPKMEKFLNLKGQAWDRLILKQEAGRRFIRTNNNEVIGRIASFEVFQRNGVFDKRLYGHIVENIFRSSPRDFEESVRDDIVIGKLIDSTTKDVALTDDEIRNQYRAENELADVSFLLINPESYKKQVSVNKKEALAFYEKSRDRFRSPVSVDVTYIRIPFDNKKEESKLLAEEIMISAKRGRALEELSKEYGMELEETGFFSINSKIPKIGLSYPFALAALGLDKNQISDVIESGESFYVMRLKSKRPPTILPFEEVEEQAKEMLIQKKAEDKAEAFGEELLSEIKKDNKGLEAAGKEYDYDILSAKQISKTSYVKEIGLSDSFGKVVFSLNVDETGGPAKTQKGYAIVRLDTLKPIDEEAFLKGKGAFAEKLLKKKETDQFQKWFMEIKKKAALKDNTGQ